MFLTRLNEALASKNRWQNFLKDRLVLISLVFAVLINIIQWGLIYIKIAPNGQNILLHYNVIYGTDLVDSGYFAYLIPGIALIFLALNFLCALWLYGKEKLSSYFLSAATVAVQIIFFVAAVVLVVANN